MSNKVHKFAPTAVLVGISAWCCWPYLNEGKPLWSPAEEASVAPLKRDDLSPETSAPSGRDPFVPVLEPPPVTEVEPPNLSAPILDLLAPAFMGRKEVPEIEKTLSPQQVLSRLRLDATCLGGTTRCAVINGQVFTAGDNVLQDGDLRTACVLEQVFRDRVLLRYEQQTWELPYSDATVQVDGDMQAGDEVAEIETAANQSMPFAPRAELTLRPSSPRNHAAKAQMVKELLMSYFIGGNGLRKLLTTPGNSERPPVDQERSLTLD